MNSLSVLNWVVWPPPNGGGGDKTGGPDTVKTTADVSFLPPMMRRRLSATARISLFLAHDCLAGRAGTRSVFGSRYGELDRTVGILSDILADQPASPAAFSQSVHNLPSGLHAIATGNRDNSCVVAAGPSTLEAAFIEAAGLVADRPGQPVLLVCVDAPLPEAYQPFRGPKDETESGLALLLDLKGDVRLTLDWRPSQTPSLPPAGVPASYDGVTSLLRAGQGRFGSDDGRLSWTWEVTHAQAA